MPRGDKALVTFNGGVWSPKLNGRVDLEGASSALRSSVNFIVRPSGVARRRAGLRFVATVTEPLPPVEPPAVTVPSALLWRSLLAPEISNPLPQFEAFL